MSLSLHSHRPTRALFDVIAANKSPLRPAVNSRVLARVSTMPRSAWVWNVLLLFDVKVVVSGPGGFVFKVEAMLDEIGVPPEAIVSLD